MIRVRTFLSLLVGFLTFVICSPAFPQATQQDPACQFDKSDPNDVGYRLTSKSLKYADQCINAEKLRAIRNLEFGAEQVSFNNYMHDDQFWKAEVKLGKVKAVYFQIMRFAAIEGITAAHTQIRFVFENPEDVSLSNGSKTSNSQDLLVSFEAAFPKEVNYNFALGAFNNYAIFARVLSTQQKASDSAEPIEQYELNLSDDEKNLLLRSALLKADQSGMQRFYNTLRPNCTTEVFDLIDSLPRFKETQAPFLTVISADPIAGPSLNALRSRSILERRVQDYEQEAQGILNELPIPFAESAKTPFLPRVDGAPWTMNILRPDTSSLSEEEKMALKTLQDEILSGLPALLQSYGSMSLLSQDQSQGLFLQSLRQLVSHAPEVLRRLNSKLPQQAVRLSLYFSPFQSTRTSTDLSALGLPAEVPFSIRTQEIGKDAGDGPLKAADFYGKLNAGIYLTSQQELLQPSEQVYLLGIALVVNIQKDRSKVFTQLMLGLDQLDQSLSADSPQVRVEKIIIPKGNTQAPALVLTHVQEAQNPTVNEFVDLQFGAFGGIAGPMTEFGLGTLQVSKNPYRCSVQTEHTPYFFGTLSDRVSGFAPLDFLIKGQPIQFHLTRMSLNLKTQEIADMNLAIKTLGLQCLNFEDANKQFTDNANQALQELMNSKKQQGLLGLISPLLN